MSIFFIHRLELPIGSRKRSTMPEFELSPTMLDLSYGDYVHETDFIICYNEEDCTGEYPVDEEEDE